MAQSTAIPFTLGSRKLWKPERQLDTLAWSLSDLVAGNWPQDFSPKTGAQGLRVLSAPPTAILQLQARYPRHALGGRQDYRRYYIAMEGSYDDYLSRFSGKTRSTLRRKQRKLAKEDGGSVDVREYRTPDELPGFLEHAVPLSALTYQERLLDSGLPSSQADRSEMRALAEADQLRAYLLFLRGKPVSYLYLPIEGHSVRYAFLGYDPAYRKLSPGTVLQMEALERLFAEDRYRTFDFTEGEGGHKAMFATDSVEACSFYLLEPGLANRALMTGLNLFDSSVALAKSAASNLGAIPALRQRLRG